MKQTKFFSNNNKKYVKSKRVFFCQLQLNTTMVIERIKMVCSNITVDNDEAGFKHNSNEVIIF